MKSISVIALEKAIEELQQEKTIAVRKAAQPYDEKIAVLFSDIAKITGNDKIGEPKIGTVMVTYTGAKRGRKPRLINSLVFPKQGTVISKLIYVIKESGRFLTIGEIANSIKVYEQGLSADYIKERYGKHIDKYRRNGQLYSYRVGSRRNTVYGLPNWIGKDEKPLPGREHNPEALIDKVDDTESNRITFPTNTAYSKSGLLLLKDMFNKM